MNLGYYVTRLNSMTRELQAVSAGPGNEKEAYELATNIMLEANKIRELLQGVANDQPISISNLHPIVDDILRLFRGKA